MRNVKILGSIVASVALTGCAMGPQYECKVGQVCQTEYQTYQDGKANHNPNAYSVLDKSKTHTERMSIKASGSVQSPQYVQSKIANTWIRAFVDQNAILTNSHTISWVYSQGHWQGVVHTKTANQSSVLSPVGGGNPGNN